MATHGDHQWGLGMTQVRGNIRLAVRCRVRQVTTCEGGVQGETPMRLTGLHEDSWGGIRQGQDRMSG